MKILHGPDMKPFDLKQDQINFYHDNGYLVVGNLLSEEECDAINKLTRKHADSSFSAILNPDRKFEEIHSVMKSPKIVSILSTLMNAEVVGLMSQVLFKEAGSPYAGQAWNPHQDNTYPQTPNGEYVTINIALQDQNVENGCLYIYPGSHKEGLYPFEPTVSYHEDPKSNPGNMVDLSILKNLNQRKPI